MAKIVKRIYKRQLKAHRVIRQELGIIKLNPNMDKTSNIVRACGMCSNGEGVLCYKHRMERLRLLRERIGKGYGKCSHFSSLMVSVLPDNWHKIKGKNHKQELFIRGMRIVRMEANRKECKPCDLQIEGWSRQVRHYKTRKSKEGIEQTEVGEIRDYFTIYEQHMIGDFPILVKGRNEVTVHIPARIMDEIRWLTSNRGVKTINKSTKLERRCSKAYFTKQGLGYIGTKFTYKNMGDLIGRKTFYLMENEKGLARILKCSGVDLSSGMERAIFQDYSVTVLLNHNDLQELGYSRITE